MQKIILMQDCHGLIYDDKKALSGSKILSKLTSAAKTIEKGEGVLPANDPIQPKIVKVVRKGCIVRKWRV